MMQSKGSRPTPRTIRIQPTSQMHNVGIVICDHQCGLASDDLLRKIC